jgi:RimJ/RimL family protein N-acetyltransferase
VLLGARKQKMFSRLETSRLLLRRFIDADLTSLLAYRNDPEIARYQSWESFTEEEAREFVREQKIAEPGVPGKWFQFAIEGKEAGGLIGDCALKIDPHDRRQGEIGFTLARPYQGQGYAGEAASCVLDFAFSNLDLHRVVAITDCRNRPSVALLERLGLRREGHYLQNIWFKGEWGDEYSYAILKYEWMERSPSEPPLPS